MLIVVSLRVDIQERQERKEIRERNCQVLWLIRREHLPAKRHSRLLVNPGPQNRVFTRNDLSFKPANVATSIVARCIVIAALYDNIDTYSEQDRCRLAASTPMQSLLLPAPWFSNSHFGPHRFDFDPGRIPTHSRPPSTGSKPSLRADHPSPPMSGFLPTSTQSDGVVTTQQQRPAGPERPTSIDLARTNLPLTLPTLTSIGAASVTHAPRFVSPLQTGVSGSSAIQIPSINAGLSQVLTEPPQAYGLPASNSIRSLPPRSTRRAKAHVASACVNCKRKHLGCDSARPCRRCVLSGKAVGNPLQMGKAS